MIYVKQVSMPNGVFVPITHIGTVVINTHLVLYDVLVILSFTFNLLSIGKLNTQHPYHSIFSFTTCYF
ncbi:hypothetical protein LINPERPRIM_LOCUS28086 [Linum perenne]